MGNDIETLEQSLANLRSLALAITQEIETLSIEINNIKELGSCIPLVEKKHLGILKKIITPILNKPLNKEEQNTLVRKLYPINTLNLSLVKLLKKYGYTYTYGDRDISGWASITITGKL